MTLLSGSSFSYPILFPAGTPAGNISWSLSGPSGILTSGSIDPPDNSVSSTITVSGTYNTLTIGAYQSYRDLTWNYTDADGVVHSGNVRYILDALLPYGVSPDGVRNKLGVDSVEISDEEIELTKGFLSFRNRVTSILFDAYVSDESLNDILVRDAIEAYTALRMIPTMRVRIANKESSGTDTYQREKINWEALGASLEATLLEGLLVFTPTLDATANFDSLFVLAPPSLDGFTGA